MAEHSRIDADPDIMVGKPIMELIVRRFADGYTLADILDDYPHLTAEDVHAALAYAADAVGRPSKPRAA